MFNEARTYDELFREITKKYDASNILSNAVSLWHQIYNGVAMTNLDIYAIKLANEEVRDYLDAIERLVNESLKGEPSENKK